MDASRIKWLVMDVDGTLTDGKIYMGPDGEVMKAFDIKDGYGIAAILPKLGIEPVVITGRRSEIVERRCAELGVKQLYQGVGNKLLMLADMLEEKGSSLGEVAFIGDDLNDLECMIAIKESGGLAACTCDAAEVLRGHSAYTTKRAGGNGAVRELIDWLNGQVEIG